MVVYPTLIHLILSLLSVSIMERILRNSLRLPLRNLITMVRFWRVPGDLKNMVKVAFQSVTCFLILLSMLINLLS